MSKDFVTSKKERLSYGSFFLGQNVIFVLVSSYLLLFYTDVVGIGASSVALLFLIARVWDAVNDPMLGAIVDKAELKKGKFLPWVNSAIILLPVATILVFINPDLGLKANLVYAYVTYILWGMFYTISDVPIFALVTAMTDKGDERVALISIGRVAGGISSLVVAGVAFPVVERLGWTQAAIALSLIAFVTMIPVKFFVKERIRHKRSQSISLKTMFKAITGNKHLLIFYLAFLLTLTFNTASVTPYFAIYGFGSDSLVPLFMLLTFSSVFVLALFLPPLIAKYGKKRLFIILLIFSIICSLIQYFVGYSNLAVSLILTFFKSVGGLATPIAMMGMFSADCAEYGAHKNGTRNEGMIFATQTFSTKLGLAFSGAMSAFLLDFISYVPKQEQSPETISGLLSLYTLVPIIGLIMGAIIVGFFYKLKESDVQRMVEEMKEKEENPVSS